jgi:ATP-dependent Clp protease ATP-binding subunit ClpB
VNFKNTVIIMTSNLGSDFLAKYAEEGGNRKENGEILKAVFSPEGAIQKILREFFRPEFLNRLDDIIVFHSLSKEQMAKIVELQLRRVSARLAEKGITLDVSKKTLAYLAEAGYDAVYGARPLKRLIQSTILDELSLEIVEGRVHDGDTVSVDEKGGKITLAKK